MAAYNDSVDVMLAKIDARLCALERVTNHQEEDKILVTLQVQLGQLQTQVKIVWALQLMTLTGLVGVAFSIFKGGP